MISGEGRPAVSPRRPGRDYALLFGNNLIFFTAINLVSAVTILPVFVSHLTDSTVLVGMVPAMVQLSFSVPQILGPSLFAATRIKKWRLAASNIVGASAFALFGLSVIRFGDSRPSLILAMFFLALIMLNGSAGIGATGWVDIVGKIIDKEIRGRFFGASHAAGGIVGAIGIGIAAQVLGNDAFPDGYGILITIAGLMIVGGGVLFLFLREPASPESDTRNRRFWASMRGIPGAVAGDRQFLHYAGARVAVAWAVAASAFITVFGSREFGASDADIARLTTVFLLSQVAGSLGGGMVGDRFGVRSLLVAGSLASLGAVVVAALATDLILVYVAIAIAGLVSMLIVADITMVLDTAPESRRPAYMAALNLILGPLSLPAPLILGLLVDVAGFRMMFTIAIALALIGLAAALSFALRPPRTVEAGP